jgi:hypothetical protein
MRLRFLPALLAACLMAQTQTMTVANLMDWLRNPATSQESDAALARFLSRVKLAGRLDDQAIEILRGKVLLGPKTMDALRKLRDQSSALPKAAPAEPAAAPTAPPSAEEQAAILDEVRRYALEYSQKLPDFVCLEMERRFVANPARAGRGGAVSEPEWRQVDTITKRLSYFEQKEEEKVLEHNHAYTTQNMKSLGGSQSFGDFGSMMRQMVPPGRAARDGLRFFRPARKVAVSPGSGGAGDRHRLPRPRERRSADPRHSAGQSGSRGHTAGFPLRSASDTLYYENQTISGLSFLLPSQVEVRMGAGDYLSRNVKEYQAYRKYSADVSITFDDVPAAPPPGGKAQETAEPGQPAK